MSTTMEETKKGLATTISLGTRVVFQRPSERTSSKYPKLGTTVRAAQRGDKFVYVEFDNERGVQKRCSAEGVDLLSRVITYAGTDPAPTEEDWAAIGLTAQALSEFCETFKLPPNVATLKDGSAFEYQSVGGSLQSYLTSAFNYRSGYVAGRKKPPEQTTRLAPSPDYRLRLTWPTLDIALQNPAFAKGFEDGRCSLLENTPILPEPEEPDQQVDLLSEYVRYAPEVDEVADDDEENEEGGEGEDREALEKVRKESPGPPEESVTQQPAQLDLIPQERPSLHYVILPLSDLPPNEELPSPEPGPAFVQSVKWYGVLEPILVKAMINPPVVQVLAGRRRIKAARAAGLREIGALAAPPDLPYDEIITLAENQHRKPNPIADMQSIRALIKRGASEEQICEATGLRKGELRKFLPLLSLNQGLLEAMEVGKISASVALAASRRSHREQAALAELLEGEERLTLKDVNEIRRVTHKAAFSMLPPDMFESPEPEAGPTTVSVIDGWARLHSLVSDALQFCIRIEPKIEGEGPIQSSVLNLLQETLSSIETLDAVELVEGEDEDEGEGE